MKETETTIFFILFILFLNMLFMFYGQQSEQISQTNDFVQTSLDIGCVSIFSDASKLIKIKHQYALTRSSFGFVFEQ